MQITNTQNAPRGVNTTAGQVIIEPGRTLTAEVHVREKAAVEAGGFSVVGTYTPNPSDPALDGILNAGQSNADSLMGTVYTGIVAGKCRAPFAYSTPNKQWGGRLGMRARDDMFGFQLMWPNWRTNGNSGEAGTGAPLTITASVEYPAGTRTQVTFNSGSVTGTIADLTEILSDPVRVAIPNGAKFWVHVFCENQGGMLYVGGTNTPFANFSDGDTFQYAASGLTDKTMSGDYGVTDGNGGFAYPPIAVIGATRRPSFALLGTSRQTGVNDRPGDAFNHHGQAERAVGGNGFGYTNLSQSAETANTYNGSGGARRRAIVARYATHVFIEYGVNDLGGGFALTRLQTLWNAAKAAAAAQGNADQKLYQFTTVPITTSVTATTAGSSAGTTASLTISAVFARNIKIGQKVRITGVTPSGYNGTWPVTAVDSSTGVIQVTTTGTNLGAVTVQGAVSDMGQSKDNQIVGANEAERVALNGSIRNRPAPLDGVIDVADVAETYRNSGIWRPEITYDNHVEFDGLHDSSLANQAYAQSGIMAPALFRRGRLA
jgi:hypothetical protein